MAQKKIVGSRLLALASGMLLGSAYAQQAPAQSASEQPEGLQEIVVTAQKRVENVQDTPIAIATISGDTLRQEGVTDVTDLQNVAPSVQIGTSYGGPRISIRGIGSNNVNPGSEERVAYYIDGVYISRPEAILGTFFDIDRIEVLRGPQGTLYGRNAIAGDINVITGDPSERFTGFAQETFGTYDYTQTEAAIGGPLTDTVSARVAVEAANRGGYGTNFFNGEAVDNENTRAARLKLKYQPSDIFNVVLSADYFRERDSNGEIQYVRPQYPGQTFQQEVPYVGLYGPNVSSNPWDQDVNTQPMIDKDIWGIGAIAHLRINDNLNATSITGYRHTDFFQQWDNDGGTFNADVSLQSTRARQFSQEFQLAGEYDKLHFVSGLYYFYESQFGETAVPLNGVLFGAPNQFDQGYYIDGTLKTKAYAVFGQLSYDVTKQFSIDLGARFSAEEKQKIDERFQFDLARPYAAANQVEPLEVIPYDSIRQTAFDPKATLNYKPIDDLLFYATFTKGFKSGGYNLGGLQPAFKPEEVKDYEGGIKFEAFDHRLRADFSGFYYKYTNLQVEETVLDIELVKNAAAAKLYGAEAQITVLPIDHVKVDFYASALHSEFTNFITQDPAREALGSLNLEGNRLPQAPPYTAMLGAQYTWDVPLGHLALRGEGNWVGKTYFSEYNLPEFAQDAYAMYSAFLNFDTSAKTWSGSLYVKNIANGAYLGAIQQVSTSNGAAASGSYLPPRTAGVRVAYHF